MKRIVFIHAAGPFPGLYQIMGNDELMPVVPLTAENFPALDRTVKFARFNRQTERAIFFKEEPPVESVEQPAASQ